MAEAGKASFVNVAVKAIVVEGGRLLTLVKRDEDGAFHVLPGGTLEPGETLAEGLAREVREEVGARVEVGPLRHVRDYIASHHAFADRELGLHRVEMIFECRLLDAPRTLPQSHPDARQIGVEWVPLGELTDLWPQALIPILQGRRRDVPVYLGDVN